MVELLTHIERIVRPLPLSRERQLQLRRELYAHLRDIFDQEIESGKDQAAAIQNAIRRFGDGPELTSTLEESISSCDKLAHGCEALLKQGHEESVMAHASRVAWLIGKLVGGLSFGTAGTLVCIGWLLDAERLTRLSRSTELLAVIVAICMFFVINAFVFTLLFSTLLRFSSYRTDTSPRRRDPWLRSMLATAGVGSFSLFLGSVGMTAAMLFRLPSMQQVVWAAVISLVAIPIVLLAVKIVARETEAARRWFSLDLTE